MAAKADLLLRDYRAKRDFSRTLEPSGKSGSSSTDAALAFVVQKHDATRLHYDFRIELDGVLKSWAVTKGPSDFPGDKRLAVRVEDHPLDYGSFEGTIPKGEYGGGTVMLWDQGTWEPLGDPHEGLRNGDLKLRLHGRRMKGDWVLVHMKGRDQGKRQNWLLIKHDDAYAKERTTLVERFTTSVSTGRDLDGIARGHKPRKKTSTPASQVWHSSPSKAGENQGLSNGRGTRKRPSRAGKAGKGRNLPQPDYRAPQLATLVDAVPESGDWVFEMKYDGYRCLASVTDQSVKIYTRNGHDWTDKFGVLVSALSQVTTGSALIDGEICAFDSRGRTDFSTLKAALSDGGPLVLFAFDLLEQDGEDLSRLPLDERKDRLENLLGRSAKKSPIQFSPHVRGNGQRVFDTICREGHEGIIAKQANAPYRGERTRGWLKIKCTRRQEFVIAGWTPSEKKKTFRSLLLGTWEDGRLVYRGRVGTGFTREDAESLQQHLDRLEIRTKPYDGVVPRPVTREARWVKPDLVAEIAFTEITPDGSLRHPSFLGLREDKPARGVRIEEPVPVEAAVRVKKTVRRHRRDKLGAVTALTDDEGIAAAAREHVRLTSPERVVYPKQGVTKAELVAYYDAVAERMLPYIADRPLSLLRCPQGRAKYCFFQKHNTGGFPDEMKSVDIIEKDGGTEDYFYIEDLAGLIAGTQMNVLEWHLWGSQRRNVEKAERLIFDIDPDLGLDFSAVRSAAFDIRDRLKGWGLKSYALISGGKGVHVIAPIVPKMEWPEIKQFCRALAQHMAQDEPDRFTAQLSKARRKGKLFIDYLRNERGSTAIAPWSTRSREGAPVAVPVSWDELETIAEANQFSLSDAAARAREADPWPDYFDLRQTLTKSMLKKAIALGGE